MRTNGTTDGITDGTTDRTTDGTTDGATYGLAVRHWRGAGQLTLLVVGAFSDEAILFNQPVDVSSCNFSSKPFLQTNVFLRKSK